MLRELWTTEGENLAGIPWTQYPRPQLRRESYVNLNGPWEFSVDDDSQAQSIQLPFCPESALSGIRKHFREMSTLCYRRRTALPEGFRQGRVLLHIGAADQHLEAFVNGIKVGSHSGGYTNMTFDITHALKDGENELKFYCVDDLRDLSMPYGKQVVPEKRGGMWYTPVSGIWQSVWMEAVPEVYIKKLSIENRGYSVTIDTGLHLPGVVRVEELGEFALVDGKVTITPETPRLWSPETPYLYDFTLEVGEDKVESYFAIRSLEVKQVGKYPRLCLNGKPYFFHGLLDQGYWPEGLLTPPAAGSYAADILAMKKLGFNTLRKHIKVEMEEFYYQCDKLGMIVWQDMVNNSDYQFLRDTALPTVGVQKWNDKRLHKDADSRARFRETAGEIVQQLKNHPCICYWTIFNEGWGQFDSDQVFGWFKTLDDTRFVDATSGWFRRKQSDVDSRHVYFRKVKLVGDGKKPLVLSEFGGKTYAVPDHVYNPEKSYGYGGCETPEALNQAVKALYLGEILPSAERGLCGAIYTQVSDVEDEINGLLTYDRKVEKLRPEVMLPVAEALQGAVGKG